MDRSGRSRQVGTKWGKLPRGVTIRKNKQSESIQINFTYKGVRCRELLSIPVSKSNIKFASNLLGEIHNCIARKTFDYVDYFPNSSKLKIFGTASKNANIKIYLNDYIDNCKKRGLSHTSIEGYEKCVNALTCFHDVLVTDLEARHILHYIESSKSGEKTIRNRLSVLRCALGKPITEGLIKINPVNQVKISLYIKKGIKTDARNQHEDVDQFTHNEVLSIYDYCKPDELNIIQFAFNTGVRPSEWAGLKWCDINFTQQQVHIVEAYMQGQTKGTKSKAGRRIIPLNEMAIMALMRQKELTYNDSDYVFLNRKGKPWNHDSFRKDRWRRILMQADVRYRYPYQMRHTFATKHISQGENLWKLSQWMGHSSPEMLFQHYGNFIEEYEREKSQKDTRKALNK